MFIYLIIGAILLFFIFAWVASGDSPSTESKSIQSAKSESVGYLDFSFELENVKPKILRDCELGERLDIGYSRKYDQWLAWSKNIPIIAIGEIPFAYVSYIKKNKEAKLRRVAILTDLDIDMNICYVRVILETEKGKLPKINLQY